MVVAYCSLPPNHFHVMTDNVMRFITSQWLVRNLLFSNFSYRAERSLGPGGTYATVGGLPLMIGRISLVIRGGGHYLTNFSAPEVNCHEKSRVAIDRDESAARSAGGSVERLKGSNFGES